MPDPAASIELFDLALPHGITLSCRAAGPRDAPVIVLLHGFPEAAFVWDDVMAALGGRFRCVAPNLRGYERSSAPKEVEAYLPKLLVADVASLIEQLGAPVELLVAHDWGGALAWSLAAQRPQLLKRLMIVNSPHPAVFLRELRDSPRQQAASAYMHFLCRPDAEALLARNDFERLWSFFINNGGTDPRHPGGGWLTEPVRQRYREVWRNGLTGPLNYYRASPLKPPIPQNDAVRRITLAKEAVTVQVPTLVLWGEADTALPPSLLDGLADYLPQGRIVRVPGATHWIVHEQPQRLVREIEGWLTG